MPYTTTATKAKDDGFSFQDANNIKNNTDYLKTQSEVLVDANATVPKDQVVPAATLKAATAPVEGASPVARAASTGGQAWEGPHQLREFWVF